MLFLELFLDMIVCMAVHGGGLMKKACALTIGHLLVWISSSIDLTNDIPIGTSAVCHISLEVDNQESISSHDFVEAPLHDILGLIILRLHITYCNNHHPIAL